MKALTIYLMFAAGFLATACMSQPDYRAETSPPTTVTQVDLVRYAGLWYEIARYPNRFEENCEGVTAEYIPREDGRITVKNTCREGSPNGNANVAEGVARVVNSPHNSQLRVKFAPAWVPFAEGDYWILHLEEDYSAALVGDPSGKYLWILARDSSLGTAELERVLGAAARLGYQTEPFYYTRHN